MAERRPILAGSPVFWTMLKFVLLGPLLRLLFRPRVTGLEHIPAEGGAILAANHVSFLDPLLLPLVVPRRRVMFLAKVKYIDKPLLHWFLRSVGVIPVATDDPAGAVAAGVRAVRDGRLVGIFPEGTRSPDGRLRQGKTGVARIAIQAGVPVIPAGITGTDLAFPRGAWLPRPRSVRISFGPPIRFPASQDLPAPQDAPAPRDPPARQDAADPHDAAAALAEAGRGPSFSRRATDQVMAAIGALSGQHAGPDIT
jgi:1-acyl-sn-glycerol-3-phosphate acyltransferase